MNDKQKMEFAYHLTCDTDLVWESWVKHKKSDPPAFIMLNEVRTARRFYYNYTEQSWGFHHA